MRSRARIVPTSMGIEFTRNFCIIAHIDHGKTTLSDRLLERTGTIHEREKQDQLLDSMDLERERGITIKAHPVTMRYTSQSGQNYRLNLLDTPGHVDFSYEVSRSLAACEGALLVVDAAQGVEAQTVANVHLAHKQGLTIVPIINKIDLPNADVASVHRQLEEILAIPAEEAIDASAKMGIGIDEILEAIVKRIPPPRPPVDQTLRALVFDSVFDVYRGVVGYVRVVSGTMEANHAITFMSNNARYEIKEVGVFTPKMLAQDRRYHHRSASSRARTASGFSGNSSHGLQWDLPHQYRRLRTFEDGNREAAFERRRVHLSTGEFRCARIRISLRIPGIATHGDHPGTAPARV